MQINRTYIIKYIGAQNKIWGQYNKHIGDQHRGIRNPNTLKKMYLRLTKFKKQQRFTHNVIKKITEII